MSMLSASPAPATLRCLPVLFVDHIHHGGKIFNVEFDLWGPPPDAQQQFC
jgi:hypothetical protein